jgi:hypothetical protein
MLKKNTARAYTFILSRFCRRFGDRPLRDLTTDDVLSLLNWITEGITNLTRHIRFSQSSTFVNFIVNKIDASFQNPSGSPLLRKLSRLLQMPIFFHGPPSLKIF